MKAVEWQIPVFGTLGFQNPPEQSLEKERQGFKKLIKWCQRAAALRNVTALFVCLGRISNLPEQKACPLPV